MNRIFTVRDDKAEAYLPPFYMRTIGEAIRAFTAAVNDQKHDFRKYAEDYHLYELGRFDELTGKMDVLDSPKHVIAAVDVKTIASHRKAAHQVNDHQVNEHNYNQARPKTFTDGRIAPKESH